MAGASEARGAGRRAGPERGWDPARKTRLAVHVLLWQLLALAGRGTAVYLEVGELEEKCFIQEIPEGTVVIGACVRARNPLVRGLHFCTQNGEEAPRDQSSLHPWGHNEWAERPSPRFLSMLRRQDVVCDAETGRASGKDLGLGRSCPLAAPLMPQSWEVGPWVRGSRGS